MDEPLVPLSVLQLDCAPPPDGWPVELGRRGVGIVVDDIGRPSIPRSVARDLLAEQREEEERKARHLKDVERRAVEADQAFRATLPRGIPVDAVPAGMTAGMLMMALDKEGEGSKRETVVEHALRHRDGAIVYHSVGGVVEGASEGHSVGGDS